MNIAILGSNSTIAKSLIYNFIESKDVNLYLFSTNKDKLLKFINTYIDDPKKIEIKSYEDLKWNTNYNCIINCIGTGSINKLTSFSDYFTFPEYYDNICIDYVKRNADCLYIHFSSGAVYGKQEDKMNIGSKNSFQVNKVDRTQYYSLSKLYTEAKHRSFENLKIIDLRIFSYFSRFIDLKEAYLINDIINCINNNEILKTNINNIVRDYINPSDLYNIIRLFIKNKTYRNGAYDVYSKESIDKFSILNYFVENYGLKYKIGDCDFYSSTGSKNIYESSLYDLTKINYVPTYSSLSTIIWESKHLIKENIIE